MPCPRQPLPRRLLPPTANPRTKTSTPLWVNRLRAHTSTPLYLLLAGGWRQHRHSTLQGYLAHETPPPQDPTVALCLGFFDDPRGMGVSYERGTPAREESATGATSRPRATRVQITPLSPCFDDGLSDLACPGAKNDFESRASRVSLWGHPVREGSATAASEQALRRIRAGAESPHAPAPPEPQGRTTSYGNTSHF